MFIDKVSNASNKNDTTNNKINNSKATISGFFSRSTSANSNRLDKDVIVTLK